MAESIAPAALPRRKTEMKLAVRGRGDVGEYFHVGGPISAGVREDIEVAEQRLTVAQNRHDAAAFAPTSHVLGTVESFCEVQM